MPKNSSTDTHRVGTTPVRSASDHVLRQGMYGLTSQRREFRINISASIPNVLPVPGLPRAVGTLRVSCAASTRGTELKDLTQSGSSKLLFPRAPDQSDLLGVCINTAGGIAGGDRFSVEARVGENSRLTLTTQAAERIYRAKGDEVGQLSTRLSVEHGARLDWLPQETILFDKSSLNRKLSVHLAADSVFLSVEPLVFGRITMGERLHQANLTDNLRLYRDGNLVFADAVRLSGKDQLASPFTANAAGAGASLLYASPDADLFLSRLRALLPASGGAGLIRDGVLFARILAPDSFILRKSLIPLIKVLRGAALPKTWTL